MRVIQPRRRVLRSRYAVALAPADYQGRSTDPDAFTKRERERERDAEREREKERKRKLTFSFMILVFSQSMILLFVAKAFMSYFWLCED